MTAILAAIPANASANNGSSSNSTFEADFSAGVEYDSNVSIDEIDTNTGVGDVAAILDADFDFEISLGDKTEFALSYGFSQSLHEKFGNFDVQSHLATAKISHEFQSIELGVAYRFALSRLDGDGFLTLQQVSPFASKHFGKRFFVRTEYAYTDKSFHNRVDRDAEVHAGGIDLYYFINGIRTYLVTGYKYENENAVAPQFDFNAHKIKVRISQRIPMGRRDAELKLGWRYEKRDYSSITPSIGITRDDDRHRFQASLEAPIAERVYGAIEYEYSDFSSNLPSADYTQSVAGIRVGVQF